MGAQGLLHPVENFFMFVRFSLLSFFLRPAFKLGALLTLAVSGLLAGCGSGSTFEPLVPSRFVVFGDGLADLGQTGVRYTINDGTTNIWVESVALNYKQTITAAVSGGFGYAQGGARITATGVAPSIEQQISRFLASNAIGANDVLILDAGLSDLAALAQDRLSRANGLSTDAALNAAAAATGQAVAAQVRRLVSAGGKYVVVANAYNLGQSPYAAANSATVTINAAVRSYNDALKISLADAGQQILLIDTEGYYSSVFLSPGLLGSGAVVNAGVCTSPSITTCTPSTLLAGADPTKYLFANDRYITPAAQRLFGTDAYNKIRSRW
jgi:outer membrane lipase/esterase